MHNLVFSLTSLVAATETPASSGGISAIGLDPKALAFQLINFAILLWILKRVAYKPILKALETRRQKIDQGLKTAKEMETAKAQMEQRQQQLLARARAEANAVLSEAKSQAALASKKVEEAARSRADSIVADARAQIDEEVKKAKAALKRETMGLVIQATEAIIDERLDEHKDSALIERALSQGEER